jgi:hypothetical protein
VSVLPEIQFVLLWCRKLILQPQSAVEMMLDLIQPQQLVVLNLEQVIGLKNLEKV